MNRVVFISILIVLVTACDKLDISPSQADSFVKYYNTFPIFRGADVKEVPGVGFAVLGTVTSYTSGTQICLIRTDMYGNAIDSARYFGGPLNEEAYCLQVLDDNGLAILGSTINPLTEKKEVYFVRTNSAGDTLWSKTIGSPVDIEAYHFEVSSTGSFIMTGYSESVKPGVPNTDIWLFGLDKAGKNIENWSAPRLIGGVKDDVGRYLQLLDNGNIVITGVTQSYPSTVYNHSFVIITNPIGGVISFCWIESTRNEWGNCIRAMDDNTFIVLGTANNAGVGNGYDIMLKKVTITSQSQQVNWEKSFGGIGDDLGNYLILKENSLNMLVTTASAGINTRIALLTTDLDGNSPDFYYIGEGTEQSGNAFTATSDNGFIITGTNKHSDNNMSLVLIKLKSDGTF